MKRAWPILVAIATSVPARAADTGGAPGTAPAGSNGSSQGVSPTGFDVSGSHPLPNGGEQEAPGRGACGCRLTSAPVGKSDRQDAALVAVLAVALAALTRRSVASANVDRRARSIEGIPGYDATYPPHWRA